MDFLLFDTLRLARTLREAGHFTAEQAETLADALGQAQHGDLATKADVARLEAEIVAVEARLKDDMHRWIVGAIGFQTIAVLGTLVALARIFVK
jgi:flagellar motility protein MotE (MotC chaperone)